MALLKLKTFVQSFSRTKISYVLLLKIRNDVAQFALLVKSSLSLLSDSGPL
jgi:hypothetical protein